MPPLMLSFHALLIASLLSAHAWAQTVAPADMVKIPAGWFRMGSEKGEGDERPSREVWLDEFFIDRHEVTNREFARFLNESNFKLEPRWLHFPDFGVSRQNGRYQVKSGMADLPVVYVSWQAANCYCRWAGMSLPTEAQWEKACRGGRQGEPFSTGAAIDRSQANLHRWWKPSPDPVGSYPPNGYGLYDMAGNISEFCLDNYQPDAHRLLGTRNPVFVFAPGNSSGRRVVRGGSFSTPLAMARCSRRSFMNEHQVDLNNFTGFRCVSLPADSAREGDQ